jgi:hypothetical protein
MADMPEPGNPILSLISEEETSGLILIESQKAIPGGVEIKYKVLSNDGGIKGVKASYTLDTGEKKEFLQEELSGTFLIEGFGDVELKEVIFSVVENSGKERKPLTVKAPIGMPSYLKAFASLEMSASLDRSLYVRVRNEDTAELTLEVRVPDESSEERWRLIGSTSIAEESLNLSIPFNNDPFSCQVIVKDKWNNIAESNVFDLAFNVLVTECTKIDGLFNEASPEWGTSISSLWDGGYEYPNIFHSGNVDFPAYFSFDMGKIVKLYSYKYWQRISSLYGDRNLKEWEVWGCTEKPGRGWSNDPMDGTGEWKLLGSYESISTDRPDNYEAEGQVFSFPDDIPPVRYIRFKVKSVFSRDNGREFFVGELKFYGSYFK